MPGPELSGDVIHNIVLGCIAVIVALGLCIFIGVVISKSGSEKKLPTSGQPSGSGSGGTAPTATIKPPKVAADAAGAPPDDGYKQDYCKALGSDSGSASLLGGKQGPRGPPGPAGAAYAFRGPLRNGDSALTRMFGTGAFAKAYLDKPRTSSDAIWTLGSDGSLKNDYGSCLGADKTGSIYMTKCDGVSKWAYNTMTQALSLTGQPDQCLTANEPTKVLNSHVLGADGKKTTVQNGEYALASLAKCSGDASQKWHGW